MFVDTIFLVVGLALLTFSGDKLVDYAAATARKARVTPTVIGLTVIALGTSLPEAFVSIIAAVQGSADISIGNVVGSNIANIALILGLVSMFVAIPVTKGVIKFDYVVVVIASASLWVTLWNGTLGRVEGAIYVTAMAIYLVYTVWRGRKEHVFEEEETLSEDMLELSRAPAWRLAIGLIIALAGLAGGAHALVEGASGLARQIGISERVIGLTVVAFGTSLPELVASIAAALKNQHEMAVANVLGSNLFNMLFVLGITSLITPLSVNPQILHLDLWVMSGVTLLLLPLLLRGWKLFRLEGLLLTLIYLGYTVYLFFSK